MLNASALFTACSPFLFKIFARLVCVGSGREFKELLVRAVAKPTVVQQSAWS